MFHFSAHHICTNVHVEYERWDDQQDAQICILFRTKALQSKDANFKDYIESDMFTNLVKKTHNVYNNLVGTYHCP